MIHVLDLCRKEIDYLEMILGCLIECILLHLSGIRMEIHLSIHVKCCKVPVKQSTAKDSNGIRKNFPQDEYLLIHLIMLWPMRVEFCLT